MKHQESKKWYFHPTVFIKILWLIFSLVSLGLTLFFDTRVLDPFYRNVVGDTSGVVLVICSSLMFCTIITGIIGNVDSCTKESNIVYVIHSAFSIVYAIAAIIFIASYGTVSVRSQSIETCHNYIIKHRYEKDNKYIIWFSKHVFNIKNSTSIDSINEYIYTYVDQRTEDVGSATLGEVCVWALFNCLMLYLWFTKQKTPLPPSQLSFNSATGEDIAQLNQRILSSSLT